MSLSQIPAALVQKAYAKVLWKETQREMYWNKFTSTSPDMPITKMENLKKEKGDAIIVPLLMKLKGEGVRGDNILEGHEEQMSFYDFTVTVDQIRHAVRLKGKMDEQKSQIDLRTSAKTGLTIWLQEKLDNDIFQELGNTTPSQYRVVYAGSRTAESQITSTDLITLDKLSICKRKAMLKANDDVTKIRPIKINGKDRYVVVLHPWQIRDLKLDPKFDDAMMSAAVKGEDNPLFSGALYMWDGIIIHEHESVPITATGSGNASVGHGIFMGAQAGALAVAQEPFWEEETFDFKNQVAFATGMIYGVKKTKFNDVDFGCIQLITSAEPDA